MPRLLASRARLLLASLWAGSTWTLGYLVAPTLFGALPDRVLAGTLAAAMFHNGAWLSIGCALLMLALLWRAPELGARRATLLGLVAAMLVCTLAGHFGLQPQMAALREAAGPGGVLASAAKTQFGLLHGVASVIYLMQSVLAGFLIVKQ
jgi:hypothetical protein